MDTFLSTQTTPYNSIANMSASDYEILCPFDDKVDLSLTDVNNYCPQECIPAVSKQPTKASKARLAEFESFAKGLYEPSAKIALFRTNRDRLRPWIKALWIRFYYQVGKQNQYNITWCHEPQNWTPDNIKTITIDISKFNQQTSNGLYKISLHINTGTIQIQGNKINQFQEKEFPYLKELVDKILTANLNTTTINDNSDNKNEEIIIRTRSKTRNPTTPLPPTHLPTVPPPDIPRIIFSPDNKDPQQYTPLETPKRPMTQNSTNKNLHNSFDRLQTLHLASLKRHETLNNNLNDRFTR